MKVYCYYKELYTSYLLFFRVANSYEAYYEDAEEVCSILNLPKNNDRVFVPVEEIGIYISALTDNGKAVKLVSRRNNEGVFSIPNVEEIENDKENDY